MGDTAQAALKDVHFWDCLISKSENISKSQPGKIWTEICWKHHLPLTKSYFLGLTPSGSGASYSLLQSPHLTTS